MKLSTRGRYGLRALVDLAANSGENAVSLMQTARRQKLSLNYLEQVFASLRRAGLVSTVKGAGGGYALARDMDEITVKEVLEALEGKISIADADTGSEKDEVQAAIRRLLWDEIDRQVDTLLESRTLGGLVRKYQCRMQIKRKDDSR